jgi:hypothetical protein
MKKANVMKTILQLRQKVKQMIAITLIVPLAGILILLGVLLTIGISISSWSMLGMGIAIFGGIPSILYRIRIEERFLFEVFGKYYQEYAEKN